MMSRLPIVQEERGAGAMEFALAAPVTYGMVMLFLS